MASTVIPLMLGGDYQARYFWLEACKLFDPSSQVCRVGFEVDAVKSFDDVAAFYEPPILGEQEQPVHADYFQIKFHVDGDSCTQRPPNMRASLTWLGLGGCV